MALYYRDQPEGPPRFIYVYLAVLFVVFVIVVGASAIWLTTDNSATNVLEADSRSTSPPSPFTAR